MAHGAAHDAAQHVAAALVRRQHAVGDQERGRAQMVGDHLVRRRLRRRRDRRRSRAPPPRSGRGTGRCRSCCACAAGRRRCAPAPCRCRSTAWAALHALVPGHLLELHEDQVPDLDEAVAVLVGAARRPAGDMLAVVEEDLRARTARAGVAHRPEIVRGRDADDLAVGEARRSSSSGLPPRRRSWNTVTSRRSWRQAVLLGDQVPGELDRLLLEIVAEREVAQHLEEGVMARGVADILEVVVLAAGAHALLRRRGARCRAASRGR